MVFWKMTLCGFLGRLTLTWKRFFFLRCRPTRAYAALLSRSLGHTQLHTTCRTPLNESPTRRRGRYLHST